MQKKCKKCGFLKLPNEFYNSQYTKHGKDYTCIDCRKHITKNVKQIKGKDVKIYWREYDKINKDKTDRYKKTYQVRYRYNLSLEEYDKIMLLSGNKCAICKKSLEKGNKTLRPNIDHCHITGIIRGILCMKCNTILGLCNDNIEILKNATKYLKKNSLK